MAKKQRILLAFVLALFCVLPVSALETGSIYIDYHADGIPLPHVEYGLHHLYTMDDGDFIPTEPYELLGEIQDLTDNEAWLTQCQTANNFIIAYGISADVTGSTDDMGRGVTEGLDAGVYLLRFSKTVIDEMAYETDPVLLVIPGSQDSDEEWNQTIIPKVASYYEEELRYRDIVVLKTWRNDHELGVRPDEITIKLYADGSLYDSVLLSEANSWSYMWTGLDGKSEWAILEEDVPEGYLVEITYDKDSNTTIYHVQNTYSTDSAVGGGDSVGVGGGSTVAGDGYDTDVEGDLYEDVDDELTQTGALLWPIPVLVCTGSLFILFGLFLRKDQDAKV